MFCQHVIDGAMESTSKVASTICPIPVNVTLKKNMNVSTPENAGFSSKRLARIQAVMEKLIEQQQIAGCITALLRRDKLVHFECHGLMDIEAGKAMQPDTIFRIYSMSKPITCVALMMLYEEGHFLLHDPIAEFIPAFRAMEVFDGEDDTGIITTAAERDITIHQLLTHSAGLSYGFDRDFIIDQLYRDSYERLDLLHNSHLISPDAAPLEQIIPELAELPLVAHPGEKWHYSVATDVLGHLVEIISGQSFDRFLQERIFEPLGMHETGFSVSPEKAGRLAALYSPNENGGLKLVDAPATSPLLKAPRFFSGGGGLLSTTSDYFRFAQMLLKGGALDVARLLSPKTVEFMTRNHLAPEMLGPNFLPGYGKGIGVKVLMDLPQSGTLGTEGMYGKGGAARTYFWVDPKEELIGLLMTQLIGHSRLALANLFKGLAYQAIVD